MTTAKTKTTKTTKAFKPQGTMALWVMTPFGFIAPSLRPRNHIPAGDDRDIQVRSRLPETLNALRERWLPELGENVKIAKTDYQVRAYCTREQLATALARMALAIDDVSFKDLSEGPAGLADNDMARDTHQMYMAVWSTVNKHGSGSVCERMGHWFPGGAAKCSDCGAANPAARKTRKTRAKKTPATTVTITGHSAPPAEPPF